MRFILRLIAVIILGPIVLLLLLLAAAAAIVGLPLLWSNLVARFAAPAQAGLDETGRGARIRTGDLLLPKQARYQAAPHPVLKGCPF